VIELHPVELVISVLVCWLVGFSSGVGWMILQGRE
jgi:hypothetical protein